MPDAIGYQATPGVLVSFAHHNFPVDPVAGIGEENDFCHRHFKIDPPHFSAVTTHEDV